MNTAVNFVKLVVAKLTGDTAQETALRNYKQASAAVNSQIAAQEQKLVDDNQALEDAEEAFENAKYPSTPIPATPEGKRAYISGIRDAALRLDEAKNTVTETLESLNFYTDLRAEFDDESL